MTAHLLDSLNAAARLALMHGPGAINLDRWAATYRCDRSDVEEAFRIAENGSRKLPEEVAVSAPVLLDDGGDGK